MSWCEQARLYGREDIMATFYLKFSNAHGVKTISELDGEYTSL